MPAGFETRNEFGNLQADSLSPVLVFIQKGTHSTTTNSSASPIGTRSRLDLTGNESQLLAIRPQTAGTSAVIYAYATVAGVRQYNIMTSSAGNIDWWVFSLPTPSIPGTKYGIEVYDSAGVPTFSTFEKTLKIKSTINQAVVVPPDTSISTADIPYRNIIAAEVGKTFALLQGATSGYRSWDEIARTETYRQRTHLDGVSYSSVDGSLIYGGFVADQQTTTSTTQGATVVLGGPRNALVIDVTGL